jgi:hypothetical protein
MGISKGDLLQIELQDDQSLRIIPILTKFQDKRIEVEMSKI